jgi:hypothetical protein
MFSSLLSWKSGLSASYFLIFVVLRSIIKCQSYNLSVNCDAQCLCISSFIAVIGIVQCWFYKGGSLRVVYCYPNIFLMFTLIDYLPFLLRFNFFGEEACYVVCTLITSDIFCSILRLACAWHPRHVSWLHLCDVMGFKMCDTANLQGYSDDILFNWHNHINFLNHCQLATLLTISCWRR